MTFGFIGGGCCNNIGGCDSAHGVIAGGINNCVCANNAIIAGGCNNIVTHARAAIVGSDITSVGAEMLHAKCLYLSAGALPTSDPSIAGIVWRDGTDLKISVG